VEESSPAEGKFALIWVFCATIGCALGATLASLVFPELGFAKNPTGEFHPAMFVFTALVGLGLGGGQATAFVWMRVLSPKQRLSWTLLTTLAVMGMIFPLWWLPAELIFFVPWSVLSSLGPGLLALTIAQSFILRRKIAWNRWFLSTLMGGVIGAVGGLIAAALAAEMLYFLPFEAQWAGFVAASMALLQCKHLPRLQS
jgi:hypothetical protein